MDEDRSRALLWLRSLVGSSASVMEARALDVPLFVSEAEADTKLSGHVMQIDMDVARTDTGDRAEVRNILLAWLRLNGCVGYTQGMHMVASELLSAYKQGRTKSPCHDALASLACAARINAEHMPLHASDSVPLHHSNSVALQIWIDMSSNAPVVASKLYAVLPMLKMFVLRCFPVLFANIVHDSTALRVLWDFIFECAPDKRADACRHVMVALLLSYTRLFTYGEDELQSFQIFEQLLGVVGERKMEAVIKSARHLFRIESISGGAV